VRFARRKLLNRQRSDEWFGGSDVQTSREQLTQVVDDALVRFRGRDLVSSAEVVDVLLDLRLLLLDAESLEQLLEQPAPAAGN